MVTELPGAWWTDTVREMDAAYHSYFQSGPTRASLPQEPSYYVDRNIWMCATFQSAPQALGAIEGQHSDRIIWGRTTRTSRARDASPSRRRSPRSAASRWPTRSTTSTSWTSAGWPALNAVECFGLHLEDLQPVADRIGPSLEELSAEPDPSQVPAGYRGFGFRTRGAHS